MRAHIIGRPRTLPSAAAAVGLAAYGGVNLCRGPAAAAGLCRCLVRACLCPRSPLARPCNPRPPTCVYLPPLPVPVPVTPACPCALVPLWPLPLLQPQGPSRAVLPACAPNLCCLDSAPAHLL